MSPDSIVARVRSAFRGDRETERGNRTPSLGEPRAGVDCRFSPGS